METTHATKERPRRFMTLADAARTLCEATGMHGVHVTWNDAEEEDYEALLAAAGGHIEWARDGQVCIDTHALWLFEDEHAMRAMRVGIDTESPRARSIAMTATTVRPSAGAAPKCNALGQPMGARAICKAACKATGAHGVYAEFDADDGEELRYASGGLIDPALDKALCAQGRAMALADDEDEAHALYEHLVGDDGPTRRNGYAGTARIYAMTLDADGRAVTENT